MASIVFNTLLVNFESVLSLTLQELVAMFKSLEASVLRKFLGGPFIIHELEVHEFFASARIVDGVIQVIIKGAEISFPDEVFPQFFDLPMEGLIEFHTSLDDIFFEMKRVFLDTSFHIESHGKKTSLKTEFSLLNDIVFKFFGKSSQ